MSSFAYVLLIVSLELCDVRGSILRKTENGNVEGIEEVTSLGQTFYAFRSVPYAEVPITGEDPHSGHWVDRRFKVLRTHLNIVN